MKGCNDFEICEEDCSLNYRSFLFRSIGSLVVQEIVTAVHEAEARGYQRIRYLHDDSVFCPRLVTMPHIPLMPHDQVGSVAVKRSEKSFKIHCRVLNDFFKAYTIASMCFYVCVYTNTENYKILEFLTCQSVD